MDLGLFLFLSNTAENVTYKTERNERQTFASSRIRKHERPRSRVHRGSRQCTSLFVKVDFKNAMLLFIAEMHTFSFYDQFQVKPIWSLWYFSS